MPKVYLSPSLQEYNPYVDGGNEEYYMNLIADAMEPYLAASGIEVDRNRPDMTLSQAIADSNRRMRLEDTQVQTFTITPQVQPANVLQRLFRIITREYIPIRLMLT